MADLPHKWLPDQEVRRNFEAVSNDLTELTDRVNTYLPQPFTLVKEDGAQNTGLGGFLAAAAHVYAGNGTCIQPTAAAQSFSVFWLDSNEEATDEAAGTGQLQIRFTATCNATNPAISITCGLYPVSASGGGAGVHTLTLGTVITGSTATITFTGASQRFETNTSTFAFPTDDYYILGVLPSGAQAANSSILSTVRLMRRMDFT